MQTGLKELMKQGWERFFLLLQALHCWGFRDQILRRLLKPPIVKSPQETLDHILSHPCSVSRFGDGEMKLIGGRSIPFQRKSSFVRKKLRESLSSDEPGHIVCVLELFPNVRFTDEVNAFLCHHFGKYRRLWYKHMKKGKIYYNALITRPYLPVKDRSKCGQWFNQVKQIWNGRDVVFIEGAQSRLGVGNDLFDNAKSIRRILAPAQNAFDVYDALLQEACKIEKGVLLLLALGPCASALALDLHKMGYQAIDIGHIDVEYEWFRMGTTKKMPIKNKFVNEARTFHEDDERPDAHDPYYAQIIADLSCHPATPRGGRKGQEV